MKKTEKNALQKKYKGKTKKQLKKDQQSMIKCGIINIYKRGRIYEKNRNKN